MQTPLGRARGLGSAKTGVEHWWVQRLTSLALIPLTIWFVVAIITHIGADYAGARAWIGRPVNAGLFVLLIAATFHHAQAGVQVVLEDYVHIESVKLAAVVLLKGLAIVLTVAGILAVLSIAFGAA